MRKPFSVALSVVALSALAACSEPLDGNLDEPTTTEEEAVDVDMPEMEVEEVTPVTAEDEAPAIQAEVEPATE